MRYRYQANFKRKKKEEKKRKESKKKEKRRKKKQFDCLHSTNKDYTFSNMTIFTTDNVNNL